jgi:L-lactate permease
VSSILGLVNRDGKILKRMLIPLLIYALIAGISGLILTR